MNEVEFRALRDSIRRAKKEEKLEEGEEPSDSSTFLEEGELDKVFEFTTSCIESIARLERQANYSEQKRNSLEREISSLESAMENYKRIHPIWIVALALFQFWVVFLAGATLEWKLLYLRGTHFSFATNLISGIFAFALIVWAISHHESRWNR